MKTVAVAEDEPITRKTFHEHGAITQAQHDKSLHDLTEKMGYNNK